MCAAFACLIATARSACPRLAVICQSVLTNDPATLTSSHMFPYLDRSSINPRCFLVDGGGVSEANPVQDRVIRLLCFPEPRHRGIGCNRSICVAACDPFAAIGAAPGEAITSRQNLVSRLPRVRCSSAGPRRKPNQQAENKKPFGPSSPSDGPHECG